MGKLKKRENIVNIGAVSLRKMRQPRKHIFISTKAVEKTNNFQIFYDFEYNKAKIIKPLR